MASSNLRILQALFASLLLLTPKVFSFDCSQRNGSSLSSLEPNLSWLSPNKEFAIGFQKLPNDNENHFLLAIWFNKIPNTTIVWFAHTEPAPQGSTLKLTDEGKLVLYDPKGNSLWERPSTGGAKSMCASMNDSGNFMLLDEDKNPIWETFKEPTDTILPGQTLNTGSNLTSRYSRESYDDGRFQLHLQQDGNLVLYTVTMPTGAARDAYWATGTMTGNSKLVFNENGYIYVTDGTRRVYNLTKNDAGSSQDFYHMARIDYDGVFKQYRYKKSKTCDLKWGVVTRFPEDICSAILTEVGSGACGYNSICVEINGEPDCLCPENYSYLNESAKNQGCRPNFELPSCRLNGWESNLDLVEFDEYKDTNWPLDDYDLQIGSGVDLQTCKQLCLKDCFCTVAVHNGNRCWKKKYPLSNGRREPNVVNGTALVKVPKVNVTQLYLESLRQNNKDQSTTVLIVSILLGSSVFINIVMTLAICIAVYFSYHNKLLSISSVSSVASTNIRSYAYKELEQATGGFKQILGKGAFGTVYKGVLASHPKRFVAIKKLEKFEQEGEKEFKTEVSVIGQTHHKNLVRLLGYCDEGEHRLLVYEYMTNGSLASLLFGITRPDWNQRVQIAFGIARGLMYLHEECVAFGMGDQEEALMDWVYACYCKKKMDKLVENDEDARNDMKKLERLVMVAIWCIQEDASLRPSMKTVTQMLEGIVQVSVPPCPSPFSSIWVFPCFRTALNLLLFLVLTPSVFAQTPPNVTLGSYLIASDTSVPWKSPSGEFAFGFHQINNQKLFLLGIWFDTIPEKTLVWYANGDDMAPEGSKVELTLDGSFRLTSPQGREIWKPQSSVDGVAYAALLNNGNFILADNSSKSLWETFKDPRDTMLPTQILEVGGKLSSRLKESSYSKGRYLLRLQPNDGSILLNLLALPTGYEYGTYFKSNTSDDASTQNSGYQLVFDGSGHLNVLQDSRSVVNLTKGRESPAFTGRRLMLMDFLLCMLIPGLKQMVHGHRHGLLFGQSRTIYVLIVMVTWVVVLVDITATVNLAQTEGLAVNAFLGFLSPIPATSSVAAS
ncbi:G-type lectin S-receptor-like serine/threonine-protein kinase LECRK2 [Populus alba x Populus x berolinensis]|nr:G-type lectin S-receptor-like serine/threonine-protein kinase LECRK2 [Populus alba x Populus x berolinensis]